MTAPEPEAADAERAKGLAEWVSELRRRSGIAVGGTIVAALLVLGVSWSFASAPGSAPDGPYHLATIWCSSLAPDDACDVVGPSFSEGKLFAEVPAEIGPGTVCNAGRPNDSAVCQSEIELGTRVVTLADDGLYPGLFHEVFGVVVGSDPIGSLLRVRMASWIVSLGLVAAGWFLLPSSLRLGSALVLLVSTVPLGVFLWASANPSGLVVSATIAAWFATVAYLRSDERTRVIAAAVLLVVAVIAAAGSRSDGGLNAFLAVVAAAVVELARDRRTLVRAAMAAGVALTGFAVSFLVLSRRLTSTEDLVTPEEQSAAVAPFSAWGDLVQLPFYLRRALGDASLGWLDTPMPEIVRLTIIGAFVGLCFMGIARFDRRVGAGMAVVAVGLAVFPYYLAWRSNQVVGVEFQPRYFLPLVPILGFVALHGLGRTSRPTMSGAQIGAVLGAATIGHSVALHTVIRRYTSGLEIRALDLDLAREWWWTSAPGPNVVWAFGSISFAVVAAAVFRWTMSEKSAPVVEEISGRTEHADVSA